MPDYRAYPFLGKARVVALGMDFVAPSDAEALDQAGRLVPGHKLEMGRARGGLDLSAARQT